MAVDPARPTTCVLMGPGRHRWEFMLLPGETAEDIATGLAAVVDAATDYLAATSDRGIGGDVNTVRITGAIVAPFTGAF